MKSLTHLQFPDSGSLYKYFAIPTVFLKKSLLFEYFSANENVSAIRSSGFSRSGELTEIVEYRGPVIKSIMCISKMSIFLMSIYLNCKTSKLIQPFFKPNHSVTLYSSRQIITGLEIEV